MALDFIQGPNFYSNSQWPMLGNASEKKKEDQKEENTAVSGTFMRTSSQRNIYIP